MKSRWVCSLDDDVQDTSLNLAVADIIDSISWNGVYNLSAGQMLARAGTVIRNHRKLIRTPSVRYPDYSDDYSDLQLLWAAIESISEAQLVDYYSDKVFWLRSAEAALRTYWKRNG